MTMDQAQINYLKIKKASYFAIAVSSTLFFLKMYAYYNTNSCSLHASAMDSFMDSIISFVNLGAVYITSFKRSKIAPLGWDKVSACVAVAQCILMLFLCFEIAHESFEKYFGYTAHELKNMEQVLLIAGIALVMSLALISYQKKIIKETDSLIVKADMAHFLSDVFSNILTFVGLLFAKLIDAVWIDAVLGLFVCFYLTKSSLQLLLTAFYTLLDLNFVKEQEKLLIELKERKYDFLSEDVQVLFSGMKLTIKIFISEAIIKDRQIILGIIENFIKQQKEAHNHCSNHRNGILGGCEHDSVGFSSSDIAEVVFMLK